MKFTRIENWVIPTSATKSELNSLTKILTIREKNAFFRLNKVPKKKRKQLLEEGFGTTLFFENNKFPAGLLRYVLAKLTKSGVYVELPKPEILNNQVLSPEGITLQDFQEEGVRAFINCPDKQGIIAQPTGSGKTVEAAAVIKSLDVQTFFFTDRKTLLHQSYESLHSLLGEDVGILGDGYNDLRKYNVAMIQTVLSRLSRMEKHLESTQLMILDEAHKGGSETAYLVGLACPAQWRLGLSATPKTSCPLRNARIAAHYGEVIHTVPFSYLVKRGWLALPNVFPRVIESKSENLDWAASKYTKVILSKDRADRILEDAVFLHTNGIKTLTLVVNEEHGNRLTSMFKANGINCEFVWYKTKNREEIIDDYRKGKLNFLVSSAILREGFDVPDIQAVQLAAGEKDHIATIQSMGRGTRHKPINAFYLLDYWDYGNEYTLNHAASRLDAFIKLGAYIHPADTKLVPVTSLLT